MQVSFMLCAHKERFLCHTVDERKCMDMDKPSDNIQQKLSENAESTDASASAVHSEVATTKVPDQKAEIANELFPPVKTRRQMRTRRVIH